MFDITKIIEKFLYEIGVSKVDIMAYNDQLCDIIIFPYYSHYFIIKNGTTVFFNSNNKTIILDVFSSSFLGNIKKLLIEDVRMPNYDYKCDECSHQFEVLQSINGERLTDCPSCNKPKLRRLIGKGVGVIFKGDGFYCTDYKKLPDIGKL